MEHHFRFLCALDIIVLQTGHLIGPESFFMQNNISLKEWVSGKIDRISTPKFKQS
jgi:hypothetical protein